MGGLREVRRFTLMKRFFLNDGQICGIFRVRVPQLLLHDQRNGIFDTEAVYFTFRVLKDPSSGGKIPRRVGHKFDCSPVMLRTCYLPLFPK